MNALIHRDYLEYGSEVHIDMYDDRLEVYSPGGMLDGSLVQNLDLMNITSKRRNPVIADIFSRLRLMERRGSGFKKIMEDYHAYSVIEEQMPKFRSDTHAFFIVLPNLNYGQEGLEYMEEKATQSTTQSSTQSTTPKASDLILSLIAKDGSLTRKQLAEETGLTEDGIKWNLNQLRKKGVICRVGPDYGGHWEIVERYK